MIPCRRLILEAFQNGGGGLPGRDAGQAAELGGALAQEARRAGRRSEEGGVARVAEAEDAAAEARLAAGTISVRDLTVRGGGVGMVSLIFPIFSPTVLPRR